MEDQKVNGASTETKGLNAYVLIFMLIVASVALTYVVPSGEFERAEVNNYTVVVPGTFESGETNPLAPFDVFKSIHAGMVKGAGTIFFILIIGGSFGILQATGALDSFIRMVAWRMRNYPKLLIPILMFIFAAMGSLMGMSDETVIYVAIVVPLAVSLGFDAITGFAIVMLGANVGFLSAVMNPFTVAVAQGIAELPTYSGIGYRLIIFVVMYTAATLFVMWYASKVQRDPSKRVLGNFAHMAEGGTLERPEPMSKRHQLILWTFLMNFVVLLWGVIQYEWYVEEIGGLFLLFAVIMGLIGAMKPGKIADQFVDGAAALMNGALIIGLAQAILVIFTNAGIMDTILYHASNALDYVPTALTAVGMFVFQLFLNFLVPSGSGQAALTMPLFAPLSDMIGVTRQTSVLAFQFGDGISNIIFPTVGYLMAALALAGIPYGKWLRWFAPFLLVEIVLASVFLIIAQMIQYGPF